MDQFLRRMHYLLNRRRLDEELADDLEFHREMAARAGGGPVGNALRLREQARDAWGWTWIDRLMQDLRYALRTLRRSPGFTAAAVGMLALGIGVNLAAFGLFDVLFLRPLPVREPATILKFARSAPVGYADNFMYPEVAFYRAHTKMLAAVFAADGARVTIDSEEKQFDASFVTANFFSDLGAQAIAGSLLDPVRDEAPGAAPAVVLSERLWQRQFGGDRSAIGRTIRVNGNPAVIAGVVSSQFSGLGTSTPDLWAPIVQQPYFVKGCRLYDFSERGTGVFMWGRLRPGASPQAAEEELRSLAAELHREHPADVWEKESLPSEPGGHAVTIRNEMYPVFALAAALALLILAASCASVGSLLVARGVARQREITIRAAVGAGRARLFRQLFTESLVLASLGLAAGAALAYVVVRVVLLWAESPPWLNPAPDGWLTLFAVGTGFASAILFGLAPAWQLGRQRHRATITRQFLIGAQVAASCILMIIAGLLVRALNHAITIHPGFEYRQVISIDPVLRGYTADGARAYFDALKARLGALPGVQSVALVSNPPLGNRWTVFKTEIDGHAVNVHVNHIDPAFLETMQIPLLLGRNFTAGDRDGILVSQSLARLRWPGEDPAGKPFHLGKEDVRVIGVTGSARLVSPEDTDAVEVYRLAPVDLMPSMVALVRATGAPEGLLRAVTAVAKSIDPRLVPEVQLMKDAYLDKVRTAESTALMVGVLGVVALLLACAGIVGIVGFAVSQRTKEIGIRMALGGRPADILAVVLRQFSVPVGVGLAAGLGGAVALSKAVRGMLYGVGNLDPIAYLGALGVFGLAVGLAALLPARRALRVDPLRALHYE